MKDTELRKLDAGCLGSVEDILEINEDWKRLMFLIPNSLDDLDKEFYEKKYNIEDIRLIEDHATEVKVKCAKVLFVEWGTSGRIRPTLNTLRKLLVKALMFRAADEISDMLNEPHPERPTSGPAADMDISITKLLNTESIEQKLDAMDSIQSHNFENSTHGDMCNDITKRTQSLELNFLPAFSRFCPQTQESDLMKFSNNSMDAAQMQKHDLIEFSKDISSSQYVPDFDALHPATLHTADSIPVDTATTDETIHTHNATESTQSQTNSYQTQSSIYDRIDNDILSDANLFQFEYRELATVTNNFSECIGSGGFGDVFVGTHNLYGWLAIKKAHNHQLGNPSLDMVKIFNNEVKSLSILRHDNIVPILGFSLDGPTPCIVCKYIDGGSLLQKIAEHVLNESQRINIMIGTAEGLKYIHSTVKPSPNTLDRKAYFIHGDVKSANILLTKDCVPKLCDFGLAKHFDQTFITQSIMGTSAYMAPERLTGTITQKSDTYSYGIVLLELLTGLGPIVVVDGSTQMNIKHYVEEIFESNKSDDVTPLLDKSVEMWFKAQSIYDIAKLCLNSISQRPSMVEVCKALHKVCDQS